MPLRASRLGPGPIRDEISQNQSSTDHALPQTRLHSRPIVERAETSDRYCVCRRKSHRKPTRSATVTSLGNAIEPRCRAQEQLAVGHGRRGQTELFQSVGADYLELRPGLDHVRISVFAQAEDLSVVRPGR